MNDSYAKKQINIEFEEEIKNLLDPLSRQRQKTSGQSQLIINKEKNNAKFIDNKPNNNPDTYKPVDFGFGSAAPYKPSALRDGIIF